MAVVTLALYTVHQDDARRGNQTATNRSMVTSTTIQADMCCDTRVRNVTLRHEKLLAFSSSYPVTIRIQVLKPLMYSTRVSAIASNTRNR